MRIPFLIILLVSSLAVFGCDSDTAADSNNGGTEATDEGTAEQDGDETAQDTDEADDADEAGDPDAASDLEALDEDTRQAALLDPSLVTDEAPEEYQILFETTQGDFTVAVDRQWGPNGADRLFNLVRIGFFDDVAFFRVIEGFMGQFGLHGDPEVNAAWRNADIPDDEVLRSNTRGKLTFATRGPNTRTTQLFINLGNNVTLDSQGFTPIGEVVDGMDVVDSLYDGYGEGAPQGDGPSQQRIQSEGNEYLRAEFEDLDYVERAILIDN